MDLPARRRVFHQKPQNPASSSGVSHSRHQRNHPGIRRFACGGRQRRRRQSNYQGGGGGYSWPLGGIEIGHGRFCSLLRSRQFPSFKGRKLPASQQRTKPSVTDFNSSQRPRISSASSLVI